MKQKFLFLRFFGEIHLNNELPENKREILKKLQALFEPVDNHMSGLIER